MRLAIYAHPAFHVSLTKTIKKFKLKFKLAIYQNVCMPDHMKYGNLLSMGRSLCYDSFVFLLSPFFVSL